MSADVTFDIQVQIIKRVVTVKSLILFRSVSNQWKSLIDSSEFIADHSRNQTLPQYLLLRSLLSSGFKYVSIVDDDSFPDHKVSPYLTQSVDQATSAAMVDNSYGLVCLFGSTRYVSERIDLWNPSIGKSVGIQFPSPAVLNTLGFGVCPKHCDPKIVMITGCVSVDLKAEVFRLSSRVWRSVSLNYRPTTWLPSQVVIDGVIHWVAYDWIRTNNHVSFCYWIISFDLTSEEFERIDLPNCLADSRDLRDLSISELNGSLVVLNYRQTDSVKPVCDIWKMSKSGVPKFTRVSTIDVGSRDGLTAYKILGFRMNGQPILRPEYGRNFCKGELKVYQHSLEGIQDIGICGFSFTMRSCIESLLLLNQCDSIIEL